MSLTNVYNKPQSYYKVKFLVRITSKTGREITMNTEFDTKNHLGGGNKPWTNDNILNFMLGRGYYTSDDKTLIIPESAVDHFTILSLTNEEIKEKYE